MNQPLPSVSVIVPTRPDQADIPAVAACRGLDYPTDRLEVIVARGRQPACQRNLALRQARGDFVYFLDDDSLVLPGNLRKALVHFSDPNVAVVGGPNLCPADAPRLERIFSVVLSSWLAFGPSRARYEAIGKVRPSNEKELILCNLLGRRETLLALGGFDESLYPNEENALMDAIAARGEKLLYDPQIAVYRRPRPSARSFLRMLFHYGRGRAEQFRRHPSAGSILNFVPPLFLVFLLVLPWLGIVGWLLLAIYAGAVLLQTAFSIRRRGWVLAVAAAPWVVLTHLLYGAGFWRGSFTRFNSGRPPASVDVRLETVGR